ncbi:CotY/CotZ family spore coat protein [Neobacillus dielmonensis]|uniref:CotY/CotZ family spore coat protein n=1 Tax=Neobacillus dielmonensis TaxID=1347369 RepID=UPI0005A98E1F|nr:CotY/CotZ family spore coat protein [Neobacillus dielmonensis]
MGCGKHRDDFHGGNCVCEVVRAILDIQNAAVEEECQPCTSCFNEPLGNLVSPTKTTPDTRVFVLKAADGSPFHAFFHEEGISSCVSIYFRVEDVFDNCCATLRVLIPGTTDSAGHFMPINLVGGDKCCINLSKVCEVTDFEASDDCVTVDLSCFCAIQCIADVDLGICD